MITISKYFIMFIIYSILGWLMEVLVTWPNNKKFVNRGFLIGPYCPIYGVGYLFITILLSKYMNHPIGLFVLISVLCSVIEYITSLVMEKLFNARWWDYSSKLLNVDGRICLVNSFAFGLIGLIGLYHVNPFLDKLLNLLSINTTYIIAIILFIIFLTDIILSFNIMASLKNKLMFISLDNTAEIKDKISDIFNNNFLARRLKNAFPKYEFNFIKKIKKEINRKIKKR